MEIRFIMWKRNETSRNILTLSCNSSFKHHYIKINYHYYRQRVHLYTTSTNIENNNYKCACINHLKQELRKRVILQHVLHSVDAYLNYTKLIRKSPFTTLMSPTLQTSCIRAGKGVYEFFLKFSHLLYTDEF